MRNIFKTLIARILAWQVRRLRKRHTFKLVTIAGSIGKTSTKFATANLLSQKYRVRFQEGNYNVDVTVPLVFFGLPLPALTNPVAWLTTLLKIERQIRHPYPYDVVVIELSTDGPGQLEKFGSFIHADIGVLTAIAPEHMEFFTDLDAVAREELAIAGMSEILLINKDLCDARFMPTRDRMLTYGQQDASYQLQDAVLEAGGYSFSIVKHGQPMLRATHPSISIAQLYSLTSAVAVGDNLGMSTEEIILGLQRVTSVPGRMQVLQGANGATLVDDTYNASPEATKAALEALYAMPAGQRIALLGNMNELGNSSAAAHTEIGAACSPEKLQQVVTLGPDANQYLAAAAEAAGCAVQRCDSPYQAGEYIKSIIKPGAVVLLKGSQNRVFAEEAIKPLLANPADQQRLVRQSAYWLEVKRKQFKDMPS